MSEKYYAQKEIADQYFPLTSAVTAPTTPRLVESSKGDSSFVWQNDKWINFEKCDGYFLNTAKKLH